VGRGIELAVGEAKFSMYASGGYGVRAELFADIVRWFDATRRNAPEGVGCDDQES
jgi:hypothetical protein